MSITLSSARLPAANPNRGAMRRIGLAVVLAVGIFVPLVGDAQQEGMLRRIGVLYPSTQAPKHVATRAWSLGCEPWAGSRARISSLSADGPRAKLIDSTSWATNS